MIDKSIIERLPPDTATELQDALKKESFYRNALYKAGVSPSIIESIMKVTDTSKVDTSKPDLYIERTRVEWQDFIVKRTGGKA